jgi:lipopolysaccharide transport system ATP-binding protein
LQDVSFEVKHGEAVGLIGRNGAGKSTLLKILARITAPTSGHAEVYGRMGSLLEVGTGFHPELTGRENVYLSGAILGMKRHEIDRKFDEILDFAGVDKFIDTPLKHYSTGMQMRLAFAVAAHLEPEILLVDEVLAVGDLEFQKKCLGKMEEVTRGGRTVVFVSHNMGAIRRLCNRGVWLDGGRVRFMGTSDDTVDAYSVATDAAAESQAGCFDLTRRTDRTGSGKVSLREVRLRACDGAIKGEFEFSEPFIVEFELEATESARSCFIGLGFLAADGTSLLSSHHYDSADVRMLSPGRHSLRCRYEPNNLKPGQYAVQAAILDFSTRDLYDYVYSVGSFTISPGTGKFGRMDDHRPGYTQPLLSWQWQ